MALLEERNLLGPWDTAVVMIDLPSEAMSAFDLLLLLLLVVGASVNPPALDLGALAFT